jgi:hypothetical protein
VQTYKTYLKIPFVLVVARSNSQGIFVFKITMEKKCTKCKEVKDFDDFTKDKYKKDGKNARCKSCGKLYAKLNKETKHKYQKEWREKNKENIINYTKKYYENNKEKVSKTTKEWRIKNKEYLKKYREENKEKRNQQNKEWRIKNKEKIKKNRKEQSKKYREKHREKINKYMNKWYKEKRKTDTVFKLSYNIRANIFTSLKKNGYNKKTKTYNILKCDYDFFMQWLNGLASNGHTYGIGELHLDHVLPMSLAKTEAEALLLNHYSNYQLLTATENQSKGNRYVNPLNLARVLEHHPNPDKIREIHARL